MEMVERLGVKFSLQQVQMNHARGGSQGNLSKRSWAKNFTPELIMSTTSSRLNQLRIDLVE